MIMYQTKALRLVKNTSLVAHWERLLKSLSIIMQISMYKFLTYKLNPLDTQLAVRTKNRVFYLAKNYHSTNMANHQEVTHHKSCKRTLYKKESWISHRRLSA